MKAHTLAAVAFLMLPSVATPATGEVTVEPDQGRRAQTRETMRFRGMDTNNDGRITRAEWRGNDRSFRNHDWNNDGVLSGDELRVDAERPGAVGGQDDIYDWTDAAFRDLDRNRDGRITRSEWQYDLQTFTRADRNRDNVLSRSEFLGYDSEQDVDETGRFDEAGRFDELDRNNNGRIEWREWEGTREAFDWLDRNNDGWLSRAETVGNDATDPRGTFASYDRDRSGTIEFDEWPGNRRSFDLRDRNGDGRLTRAEAGELARIGTSGQRLPSAVDRVMVSARTRWTDTGIVVRSGDRVQVEADGSITLSGNDNDTAGPAGAFSGRRAADAPLPSAPAGALIARIDDGPAFLLGDGQRPARVGQSGRLFLGVNDDHLADNRGEFTVRVSITR